MKAGVLGASGYTGTELLRLLASHPAIEVAVVTAHTRAGQAGRRPHAVARGRLPGPGLRGRAIPPGGGTRPGLLRAAPRRVAARRPRLAGRAGCIVDLAADFRLNDASLYPQWYGEEHARPELLGEAVYGLPELFRDGLAGATLVAAAGCYPTSAGLALAPLVRGGLVEPTGIVVDAASGVSGAGRGLQDSLHFGTVDEDFTAYGLLTHRHTPEMEQILGAEVLFTPHLAPMVRGILATCYARPAAGDLPDHGRRPGRPPRRLRRRAVRRRDRRPTLDQGHRRRQRRPRDGAGRRPHRLGRLPLRPRQPRQGRVGPGDPVRQRRARAARDDRAAVGRGCTRERQRPAGLRRRRGLRGHQGRQGPRRRRRRHRRRPGRSRRRRLHRQPGRGGTRPGEPGPPRRDGRQGGRGDPDLGQRQRRHRGPGSRRRRAALHGGGG